MAKNTHATLAWLLVALAVWGAGTLVSKFRADPPLQTPSWQRPLSELTPAQQQLHQHLRERLRIAERERAETKAWPPTLTEGWKARQVSTTVNYVGEGAGLRWLVLILEPDPRAPAEPPPPEDDEHHTLSDGTPIHVTVWTQPLDEPATGQVTAFPAAEGWVERVRR